MSWKKGFWLTSVHMRIYDVFNNGQIIQTDLTQREIVELFDIDKRKAYNMCNYGIKFFGQYYVIEVEPDEPVPDSLAREWDNYIEKFRRRLYC